MTPSEWVTIISVACAVLSSLVGGTWILRGSISKLEKEIEMKLANIKQDTSNKVGRIYERFDQYKNFIESKIESSTASFDGKFVQQKICDVLHAKTAEQHEYR